MLILTEGMSLLTTDSPHWVGASGRQMQRHTWPRCGPVNPAKKFSLKLGVHWQEPCSTVVFCISEVLLANDLLTGSFIPGSQTGTPHPGLPVHSQALWPEKASVL